MKAAEPVARGKAGSRNGRTGAKPVTAPSRRPSKTFLVGLGIGLAIGAAAGLLLAPRSGAETREALRNRGRRVRHKASDAWEELRLELSKATRALKRKRRDAKLQAASAVEQVEETLTP